MNDFIAVAINKEGVKNFIMNTSPILWTSDIKRAKKFDSYSDARYELEDNFLSLSATISYTDITSIYIVEYCEYKEIGRIKFL